MTRCVLSLCALLVTTAVGCRAPMPSFNVFAPYGPARVPAPCTGSYGAPATYYQPGAAAASVPQQQTKRAALASEVRVPAAAQATWTSASSSSSGAADETTEPGTGAADGASSAALGSSEPPIRIVESGAVPASDQQALAAAITPSGTADEPARFVPPADAQPLATAGPQQQLVAPASFVTTSSGFTGSTSSAQSSLPNDRGWRSRYQPARTDG